MLKKKLLLFSLILSSSCFAHDIDSKYIVLRNKAELLKLEKLDNISSDDKSYHLEGIEIPKIQAQCISEAIKKEKEKGSFLPEINEKQQISVNYVLREELAKHTTQGYLYNYRQKNVSVYVGFAAPSNHLKELSKNMLFIKHLDTAQFYNRKERTGLNFYLWGPKYAKRDLRLPYKIALAIFVVVDISVMIAKFVKKGKKNTESN